MKRAVSYSFFFKFANLWATVMTLRVPTVMSFAMVSGTMAQPPTKSLVPVRMRQVQGNSSGLASPGFAPGVGVKTRWPHFLPSG